MKDITLNTYGNIIFSNSSDNNLVEIRQCTKNYGDIIDNHTLLVHGNIKCKSRIISENALHVDGPSIFTGVINARQGVLTTSDIKFKNNLVKIENSLEKIKQLTGYTFNRIDLNNIKDTGLIAQDVLKILPEAVVLDKDNTLNIYYGKMIGLIVESIKELDKKMNLILEKNHNI